MLGLNEMHDVVRQLATTRPIFHSEADFQHALAWQIHTLIPNASIRLELPVRTATGATYLDLLVRCDTGCAMELKYKTVEMTAVVNGEQFLLRTHTDAALHDFWKDVKRLERYAKEQNSIGYAIFLSNDPFYWEPGVAAKRGVGPFSIHEGRKLNSGEEMRSGPQRKNEQMIACNFGYECSWKDYSILTDARTKHNQFRYLRLQIQNPNAPAVRREAE
jgi:hypothetical protein